MFGHAKGLPVCVIFWILCFSSACQLIPKRVSLDDPELAPMLKAVAAVDRQALGFTPIGPSSDVRLEQGPRNGYDVMLHIYDATSRTIAFRKAGAAYRWIAEHELHYGPRIWKTVDGDVREHIIVEYQTEPLDGIPVNELRIDYIGDDPRFDARKGLTLADIRPFLDEWKGIKWR